MDKYFKYIALLLFIISATQLNNCVKQKQTISEYEVAATWLKDSVKHEHDSKGELIAKITALEVDKKIANQVISLKDKQLSVISIE